MTKKRKNKSKGHEPSNYNSNKPKSSISTSSKVEIDTKEIKEKEQEDNKIELTPELEKKLKEKRKEKEKKIEKKNAKRKEKERRAREKEIEWENTPKFKRVLKKSFFIISGLLLSIFLGLLICCFINKDKITIDVLQSKYGAEVAKLNRIIAKTDLSITGKADGKEFNEHYVTDTRLGDDFFYSGDSSDTLFYGYNFNNLYCTDNWCYVQNYESKEWVKFNFNEFFGESAKLYMLFNTYYSVKFTTDCKVSSDKNYYYVEQNVPLDMFLEFLGGNEDTTNGIYNKILTTMANDAENFYVKNVYKFNKNNYSLVSVTFEFSEPLKQDEDNYAYISLIMEYSTGTTQDFTVPDDIVNNATEIDPKVEFKDYYDMLEEDVNNNNANSNPENKDGNEETTENNKTESETETEESEISRSNESSVEEESSEN